jgi:coenzyme Q-binding protein COQ10
MSATVVEMERRLPYAPHDLAAMVADVRSYPLFIPWLKKLDVLSERVDGDTRISVARADVGWRAISERFTSEVRATADRVRVALVSGPFKSLENRWDFLPAPNGTLIRFYVSFEFKSPLLQAVASLNRDLVASRIIAAFEGEAKKRFGAPARA